ncbi:MAG TPA: DegT/DnrJ/EryC1/StrS family aminotransferase, partial [Vicinamibacterales bacterium]|nr:DegT/DnrJ/EryC1/StrS family aminotransferase [Vicinamibacterales bacterium]
SAKRLPFFRARNAIYHLFDGLRALRPRLSVLVPDYNSGNEILALQAAGATLHFYRIGRDMRPNLDDIQRLCKAHDPDVLYVIHYLGWPQPLDALTAICRQRSMLLVEDCALALLSQPDGMPLGSTADWSIYCLYKTLPVPNGALLVENTLPLAALERLNLRRATGFSVLGRISELLVQRLRARLDGVGTAIQSAKRAIGKAAGALEYNRATVGDIGFALDDVDLAMSPTSERLIARLDFDAIRRTRVTNYQTLATALADSVRSAQPDLPDGVCPLVLPILVADKPASARALRQRGIEPLEFWNYGAGDTALETPDVRYLRSRVLGLPIHQDISPRQLAYMAAQLSHLQPQAA